MVVELHRKVSTLIEFLKQKWAVQDQRIVSLHSDFNQISQHAVKSSISFLFPSSSILWDTFVIDLLASFGKFVRVLHAKASTHAYVLYNSNSP